MKTILRVYQFANLLSLDIVAGALVSCLFFARILHVQILPWGFAALGLSVWIIYTADHLLDARRLKEPASTERHRFHQKHFNVLLFSLLVALGADLFAISIIRRPVLIAGLGLGGMVGIYLLVQGKLKSLKELSGAMLYCTGIALPAFSISQDPITIFEGILIFQFGIIAFCNLLLFSLFDVRDDIQDNHNSFVTVMGENKTKFILSVLFLINTGLTGLELVSFSNEIGACLVVFAMNLILFLIFIFPGFFRMNKGYRILGDAVFLIPIFFLLGG